MCQSGFEPEKLDLLRSDTRGPRFESSHWQNSMHKHPFGRTKIKRRRSEIASNSRGPQFESSYHQKPEHLFTVEYWKDEDKEKRGWEWPIFKKVR